MKKILLLPLLLLCSFTKPVDSLYVQLMNLPKPIVVVERYTPVSNFNPRAEMYVDAGGSTYLKLRSTPNLMILIRKYASGDTINMDSVRAWMGN